MGEGPDKRFCLQIIFFLNSSPIHPIRLAFIEDYTLKSLRLKPEKWNKLVISDDQRGFLHSFVDQGRNNSL